MAGPRKLNLEFLYDPATELWGIDPKEPKQGLKEIFAPPCSQQHQSQYANGGSNSNVRRWMNA